MSRKRKKTDPPKRRNPHALDALMRKGGRHTDRKKESEKYGARHWEENGDEELTVDEACPSCGGINITEETVTTIFEYGVPTEATLTAEVPVMDCSDCKFSWCDWRGERSRDAAVDEYLKEKK